MPPTTETDAAATPTSPPTDSAFIAAVWEHPDLCLAFFGVQYQTDEGRRLYEESGVAGEVLPALEQVEGLLLNRPMMTEDGPVLMQYWRSYADLDAFARKIPHSRWWKWLVENAGNGVSFYHEIYQVKTGEAIYEKGSIPVGPAVFSSLQTVRSGEGNSKGRQARFAQAQQ